MTPRDACAHCGTDHRGVQRYAAIPGWHDWKADLPRITMPPQPAGGWDAYLARVLAPAAEAFRELGRATATLPGVLADNTNQETT